MEPRPSREPPEHARPVPGSGLLREEEAFFSVPLGEGILALLAAISLGGAAFLLTRRRLFPASVLALGGTAPLAVFFAFTVPEHSDWSFLFASLVLPVLATATAAISRLPANDRPGTRGVRRRDLRDA